MPNYITRSSRAKKADVGSDEKLAKGNSETLQSPDHLDSAVLYKSGNITGLAKVFKLGERGSGTRSIGSLQDYHALKKKCLKKGILFEDPEFPAQLSSIYGAKRVEKDIKWFRPPGIVPDAQLFVDGASRFDVKQGQFGDCWFLAAIANLATHKNLLTQVVPENQSFQENYAGIFHFRFWQYGRWVDVVIDDRLPTFKGELLGLHSASKNEFWTALLEKAYAKLHGSYTALEAGDTGDALEDFTGGVAELYSCDSLPDDLFDVLLQAYEKNSLMGCSFKEAEGKHEEEEEEEEAEEEGEEDKEEDEEQENDTEEASNETEEKKKNEDADGEEEDEEEESEEDDDEEEDKLKGLIEGHAYSITQVKYVSKGPDSDEKIPLIRVRNPWGTEDEWLGAWSDKSAEWKSIPEETRKELDFKSADDGEFWICFQDFKDHLSDLEICYLNLNSVLENPDSKEWEISAFEGEWVSGVTAGGNFNDLEKFQYNPQYRMTLKEGCTVIIALTQKNRRIQGRQSVNFLNIGFVLANLTEKCKTKIPMPLDHDILYGDDLEAIDFEECKKKSAPDSSQYSSHRQVSCRVNLQPGTYFIIPSTYDVNEDGKFLLRVFSEKPHKIEEYHEQVGINERNNSKNDETGTERFREFFRLLSGDDWELDWVEQKKVLDFNMSSDLTNDGLSKSACRSMVAMLDTDCTGKLSFSEFKAFYNEIARLRTSFKQVAALTNEDVGYLSTFNLRKALNKAGVHVNIHMLGKLVRRYGTEDHKITLEDFIICALRVRNLMGTFRERDPRKTNKATFTLDEWIDNTLYL